jgi:large subunit ribosomal protein L35
MALKTHKALAKRITITKTGKMMKRKAGQNHFNSREPGKVTRNKRTDITLTRTVRKGISALLPYHNHVK